MPINGKNLTIRHDIMNILIEIEARNSGGEFRLELSTNWKYVQKKLVRENLTGNMGGEWIWNNF